jgi:hypothetical protein
MIFHLVFNNKCKDPDRVDPDPGGQSITNTPDPDSHPNKYTVKCTQTLKNQTVRRTYISGRKKFRFKIKIFRTDRKNRKNQRLMIFLITKNIVMNYDGFCLETFSFSRLSINMCRFLYQKTSHFN